MKLKLNRIYLIVFTLIILCGTIVLKSCTSSYNYSQQLINAIENNDYDLFEELLKQTFHHSPVKIPKTIYAIILKITDIEIHFALPSCV